MWKRKSCQRYAAAAPVAVSPFVQVDGSLAKPNELETFCYKRVTIQSVRDGNCERWECNILMGSKCVFFGFVRK